MTTERDETSKKRNTPLQYGKQCNGKFITMIDAKQIYLIQKPLNSNFLEGSHTKKDDNEDTTSINCDLSK